MSKQRDDLARRRKELADLKRELSEDHMDSAFMIISAEVNGLTDSTGHDDLLSFRLVYAESSEDFQKGDLKKVKFFMPKFNAVPLASLILEACAEGGKTWAAPPGN